MDKILFKDLKISERDFGTKEFKIGNNVITVKQYLSVEDKMSLISEVINNAVDNSTIIQPTMLEVLTDVIIVKYYTNIDFVDEELTFGQLYDILETNGIIESVVELIPEDDYKFIMRNITETSKTINTYLHSALSLIRKAAEEYNDINIDIDNLRAKMADPQFLSLIKGVMKDLD